MVLKDHIRLSHRDCTHFSKVALMDGLWTYIPSYKTNIGCFMVARDKS